jgi:hypothetical protein
MNRQHELTQRFGRWSHASQASPPALDALEVDPRELGYPDDPIAQRVAVDWERGGHASLLEVVFD